MQIIQSHLGEHFGEADAEGFGVIAGNKIGDDDGIDGAEEAPADAFDETAVMTVFEVLAIVIELTAVLEIEPYALVHIEEEDLGKYFDAPDFQGRVDIAREQPGEKDGIQCTYDSPCGAFDGRSVMVLAHTRGSD